MFFWQPLVLPPSVKDNLLDFGVRSATHTSSIIFVVVNSNPIEVRSWAVTCWNKMNSTEYLLDFFRNVGLSCFCCLSPLCKAPLFWTCWLVPIFATTPDCIATQFLQQTHSVLVGFLIMQRKNSLPKEMFLHVCPWVQFYLWGSSEMLGWSRK